MSTARSTNDSFDLSTASQPRLDRVAGSILGQYQLLSKLGQGGMGAVYLARHLRLKRMVALKKLPQDRLIDPQAVARFRREMEAVGSLDHPNLIRATDAGELDGQHFLVMEFVDGTDLAKLVRRHGPLGIADACAIIVQAARGLQYIHEHQLIHRDIKPSNVMLTKSGQVKILDLGLARLYCDAEVDDELTPTGVVMGTADFMAPEQSSGSQPIDIRADIYSLGCTLFKLLTGSAPYHRPEFDTPLKKALAHAQQPIPSLLDRLPGTPPELQAVLDRMLAKSPAQRFRLPREVADALAPWAAPARLDTLLEPEHVSAQPFDDKDAEAALPDTPLGTATFGRETISLAHKSASRRRTWLSRSLVLSSLGLMGGLVVLLAALKESAFPNRRRDAPPDQKRPAPPLNAARPSEPLLPGVWHALLAQPPDILHWPSPPRNSQWRHNVDQQEIWFNTEHLGLLGLGKTDGAFELKATMTQTPWSGGIGLFWNHHGSAEIPGSARFRYVELQPMLDALREDALVVLGHKQSREIPNFFNTTLVGSRRIPRPLREHTLHIVVGDNSLTAARWDGVELPELVKADGLADGPRGGRFGIYCSASHGVVRQAAVLIRRD